MAKCPMMRMARRINQNHTQYKETEPWLECHVGQCCFWVDGLTDIHSNPVGGMCAIRFLCVRNDKGQVIA